MGKTGPTATEKNIVIEDFFDSGSWHIIFTLLTHQHAPYGGPYRNFVGLTLTEIYSEPDAYTDIKNDGPGNGSPLP